MWVMTRAFSPVAVEHAAVQNRFQRFGLCTSNSMHSPQIAIRFNGFLQQGVVMQEDDRVVKAAQRVCWGIRNILKHEKDRTNAQEVSQRDEHQPPSPEETH